MPEIKGPDKLLSILPRKTFGYYNRYAIGQYGRAEYGEEAKWIILTPYGAASYGVHEYGNVMELSGIYRLMKFWGETHRWRSDFYYPSNVYDAGRAAIRQKLAQAVTNWQGFTPSQKAVYNQKAVGKHMSGYNFYIKQFMLS